MLSKLFTLKFIAILSIFSLYCQSELVLAESIDNKLSTSNINNLSFIPNQALKIMREDIHISENKVTINYVIKNESSLEHTMTLSMILPWQTSDQIKAIKPEPKVWINNQAKKLQTKTVAYSKKGRDVTNLLQKYLIPLNPVQAKNTFNSNNRVKLRKSLEELQLFTPKTLQPTWQARTLYYWHQTFPPASTTHIKQIYTTEPIKVNSLNYDLFAAIDCNDKSIKDPKNISGSVLQFNFNNNLTWSNPIDKFTLKLDFNENTAPNKICWNHPLNKLNETTLIFSARDFVPLDQLSLVWLND